MHACKNVLNSIPTAAVGEANVSAEVVAGDVTPDNIDTLLRDKLTLEGRIRPKEVLPVQLTCCTIQHEDGSCFSDRFGSIPASLLAANPKCLPF
jgi:hypothetical protein